MWEDTHEMTKTSSIPKKYSKYKKHKSQNTNNNQHPYQKLTLHSHSCSSPIFFTFTTLNCSRTYQWLLNYRYYPQYNPCFQLTLSHTCISPSWMTNPIQCPLPKPFLHLFMGLPLYLLSSNPWILLWSFSPFHSFYISKSLQHPLMYPLNK